MVASEVHQATAFGSYSLAANSSESPQARPQLRPALLRSSFARTLTLLFLTLTAPTVASSQPAGPAGPTPEARARLSQAAADPALPAWQREFMVGLADGDVAATTAPGAAGDPASPPERRSGPAVVALANQGPPSARSAHSAIYDPVRDRMVVFGGWQQSGANFGDVWALSLAGTPAWTELAPTGTPPSPRRYHSAIYDPVRDRMLVFGGYDNSYYYNDVWALSLSGAPAWTELTPGGTPPEVRYRHTAIYDPVGDRMVVFGGWHSGAFFGDAWELSLSGAPTWTELAPGGALPSARYSHTAIYDPARDRMVVFGGVDVSESYRNDVWALALAGTPEWAELTPAGPAPSARYVHGAVCDSVRDRMVVFGGHDAFGFRNDVWELSLAGTPAWTELAPDGTPPGVRYGLSAIRAPVLDRMVVFGGTDGLDWFNDVGELSLAGATAWMSMSAPDSFTLTVNATNGSVVESPLPTAGKYASGTAVLLTATADAGHHFVDYTGDAVALTDTVTVIMSGDKTVTAGFAPDLVTLTLAAANGSVTAVPLPTDGRYAFGTAVLLTATPDSGYHFVDYRGDAVAATDTVTVVMSGDKTVTADFFATAGVVGGAPQVTLLMPARPNPSRRSATLVFSVARGGRVELAIYSVNGRQVRALVDGPREPGEYRTTWDGRDDGGNPMPSGVYFARLRTTDRFMTRSITYLR